MRSLNQVCQEDDSLPNLRTNLSSFHAMRADYLCVLRLVTFSSASPVANGPVLAGSGHFGSVCFRPKADARLTCPNHARDQDSNALARVGVDWVVMRHDSQTPLPPAAQPEASEIGLNDEVNGLQFHSPISLSTFFVLIQEMIDLTTTSSRPWWACR